MGEEKLRILRMLQEGKITVDEATRLLGALGASGKEEVSAGATTATTATRGRTPWLRIKVMNAETGRTMVNVNLPLSLLTVGLGIAKRFADIPELDKIDLDEILAAVREGAPGKIIEVEDEEDGERVEISIE
ncbi:MAG: hypothetical protein AB1446_08500 [Bacillota bacterium]